MKLVVLVLIALSLSAQTPGPVSTRPSPLAMKPSAPQDKITITIGQLIQLRISGAFEKLKHQDLPVVMALRVTRMADVVDPEIQHAVDARGKLFTPENTDANKNIKPEFTDAFMKAATPLLAEKIELAITPLSLDGDLPGVKLSAQDIIDLGPLVKTSEPAK